MSVKVMARVWAHSQQKSGELLVMLALADFANDDGEAWPSIPVLAQKARLTERQVQYLLPKLEQAGELKIDRSNGGRNRRHRYFVTVLENPEDISLKRIHRNKYGEFHSTETVKSTSPALNHHRTINKSGAKAPDLSFPISKKRKRSAPDPAQLKAFTQFYEAYPRHVGRAEAEKAWLKLNADEGLVGWIMDGVRRYGEEVEDTEPKYIKHPATWLNQRRWEDEPMSANGTNGHAKPAVKDLGGGMVEFDGLKMTRETYDRKYGPRAN